YAHGAEPPISVRRVRGQGADLGFEEHEGLLAIRLAEPLAAGQPYQVQIDFSGDLPIQPPGKTDLLLQSLEQLLGLIAGEAPAADSGTFSYGDGVYALSRFFPAALDAPPSKDAAGLGDARTLELSDFDLELTAPAEFLVASSGVVVRSISAGPGLLVHTIR